MIKKLILITLSALCVISRTKAQEIFFDGGVSTFFDNTEYSGSGYGTARTIFAVEFDPTIGYRIDSHNTICAGVQLLKDFGSDKFVDQPNFTAFYKFDNGTYGADAGIFSRSELVGRYSRAFYSDSTLIYNSSVQGVAMRYTGKQAFSELAVDWVGLYSADTREQFRVLFAAGGSFARYFNAGVSLSVQHYANKTTIEDNVVDNILANPYIEVSFTRVLDFTFRLGWLHSFQRDRQAHDGWKSPFGGEIYARFAWKGIFVDNNLYAGKNLMPFRKTVGKDGLAYGSDLYTGDPFYATVRKIYNRTGLGYERSFLGDKISLRAEMVLQYAGAKVYTQQLLTLSARIAPVIYNHDKHNKH